MALPLPGWSCCPRGYFPQMIHVQVHSSVKSAGSFEQAAAGITSAWKWLKGAGQKWMTQQLPEAEQPAVCQQQAEPGHTGPDGSAAFRDCSFHPGPHLSCANIASSRQDRPSSRKRSPHECVESEQPESTTLLTGAWTPPWRGRGGKRLRELRSS